MRYTTIFFLSLLFSSSFAQTTKIGTSTSNVAFDGSKALAYTYELKKGGVYIFTVRQNNIDVELALLDPSGKQVAYIDVADGNNGYDKIDFSAPADGLYKLNIRSVEKEKKPNGTIELSSKMLKKKDVANRKSIAEYLKDENAKEISTLDLKHFWEAYDQLASAKTMQDSVDIIQSLYLDRATDGLKEFQKVRYFSAEFFVERIGKYKKYYQSVRNNTMLILAMDDLGLVITDFKKRYPAARTAKICFAIGPMSTGGTIYNNYVLIGLEMIAGSKDCDLSEITNGNLKSDFMSRNAADITAHIKETVVHEYVHTQQKKVANEACNCPLLENIIKEGVASYISEKLLLQKKENGNRADLYVKAHEKELWQELKSELCNSNFSKWLFNAASSKDRPGDLGYRIGYYIAEAYYENSTDKDLAFKEMIEMDHPLLFLEKSKYDVRMR